MLTLPTQRLEKIIYSSGFYKQKAEEIKQTCKILVEEYGDKVPETREELMKLPGIGGKCADIVLSYAYGKYVIAVDTHVAKIAQRLLWTRHKQPEKIREDLHRIIQDRERLKVNLMFVQFGREICTRPVPKCYSCPIEKFCPYPNKTPKKNYKDLRKIH